MKSNSALEVIVAEKLYNELHGALPDMSSRRRADIALMVINTLSRMSVIDLLNFNNSMVNYITLPNLSQQSILLRLNSMFTDLKVG
ncbi:MAG: hypothetical protein COV32_00705 [Candidatus Yonathbacteria bacterium CG10_big_fil_rev_8_21_14_0_10_43_136]|uniref:Uncharacterized protein n=2 Tax=Parcubacteria group TaxID=1794811 RepID=A0A2M7Q594_9BACT|nr:MAG: hypothetical protein AUK15_01465 [Candidatus Nomurabacteria bacterium CG2_30_43_9]PIQ35684.1 MAG: hypothetical protein COW60_02650 [Candidatus Yonathbacteria bacterium CG17_big_fil_post_rev_8_21_14_2_50_43_9]PIR40952.1 MAG: hypothetical protein COV32_00705 [Candidatus Yonathbacteria bacterium CG10_big_fil_rev_8_21_14_0_10_43_136]PIX57406.1 MAG: hypothetical protein COZ48_00960 [Candidatus Yonathbacteria bacterium CG_4_10_14_3_um_filter_43_12]PIY58252.1 MAG: hypothetical protein COY98_02